jgi:hypothetical protein
MSAHVRDNVIALTRNSTSIQKRNHILDAMNAELVHAVDVSEETGCGSWK